MSETITYTACGDYLIPNIELEPTEKRPLGKYGRMRRAYLKDNNTLLLNHLILTGKRFPHLWEIQETASTRMEQLMAELLEQNTMLLCMKLESKRYTGGRTWHNLTFTAHPCKILSAG